MSEVKEGPQIISRIPVGTYTLESTPESEDKYAGKNIHDVLIDLPIDPDKTKKNSTRSLNDPARFRPSETTSYLRSNETLAAKDETKYNQVFDGNIPTGYIKSRTMTLFADDGRAVVGTYSVDQEGKLEKI